MIANRDQNSVLRMGAAVGRISLSAWTLVGALCAISPASAQMTDQATAELRDLGWKPATNLRLPISHSEITSLPGYVMVTGKDAIRARQIEDADFSSKVEAEAVNPTTAAEGLFSYESSGYITSDDWADVDPAQFLDQVRQNTETGNIERRSRGLPELHVTRWVQQPSLNRDTHTVSWIIAASSSDGGNIINAIALKLGRYGYERIIFIDDATQVATATQNLLFVANAHRFEAGARYDDYVAGTDRAAEYGIAGLVAGVLGVKLLKVAAAGGLLLLAKKMAWVILLPIFWLWRLIKPKKGAVTPTTQPTARIEPKLLASTEFDSPDEIAR